jgi:hypothetical protein
MCANIALGAIRKPTPAAPKPTSPVVPRADAGRNSRWALSFRSFRSQSATNPYATPPPIIVDDED